MVGIDVMAASDSADVPGVVGSPSIVGTIADPRGQAVAAMREWEARRVPYIWGGHRPESGLDCSGAVVAAWIESGALPERERGWWATADLYRALPSVSREDLREGDAVFYGSGPSHVMLYAGDGRVIGATGGGPKTKTRADAVARDARVKTVALDYRRDLKGGGRMPTNEKLVKRFWDARRAALALAGLVLAGGAVYLGGRHYLGGA